mgnify:CR=1 FL=1
MALENQALIHIIGIGVRKKNQIINASRIVYKENSVNLDLAMGYHLEQTVKNGLTRLWKIAKRNANSYAK